MRITTPIIPTTRVRIEGEIRNESGTLVDPTGVRFAIQKPDGTEIEYTYGVGTNLKKRSTGIYYVDYDVEQGGRYRYRFQSYGDIVVTYEDVFEASDNTF